MILKGQTTAIKRQIIGSVEVDWLDWWLRPEAVQNTLNKAGFPLKLGFFHARLWENKAWRLERFMAAVEKIKASGFTLDKDIRNSSIIFEWWQWVEEPQPVGTQESRKTRNTRNTCPG